MNEATKFCTLFTATPIVNSICSQLGKYDIENLMLVNRTVKTGIGSMKVHQFSLADKLSDIFSNADDMLKVMRERDIIIVGKYATSMIWPETPRNEIEFSCVSGIGAAELASCIWSEYCTESEKFTKLSNKTISSTRHYTKNKLGESIKVYIHVDERVLYEVVNSNSTATNCFTTEFCTYVLQPNLMRRRVVYPRFERNGPQIINDQWWKERHLLCDNHEHFIKRPDYLRNHHLSYVIEAAVHDMYWRALDALDLFKLIKYVECYIPVIPWIPHSDIYIPKIDRIRKPMHRFNIDRILHKNSKMSDNWGIYKDIDIIIELFNGERSSKLNRLIDYNAELDKLLCTMSVDHVITEVITKKQGYSRFKTIPNESYRYLSNPKNNITIVSVKPIVVIR